ncbi:MAG: hypothetical protein LC118_00150 [Dehalococcoidia bacterium]|nr:hypothetical protein [Dehalococcoidia bacterium]
MTRKWKPGQVARALFRLPVWVYCLHPGSITGHRLLMVRERQVLKHRMPGREEIRAELADHEQGRRLVAGVLKGWPGMVFPREREPYDPPRMVAFSPRLAGCESAAYAGNEE